MKNVKILTDEFDRMCELARKKDEEKLKPHLHSSENQIRKMKVKAIQKPYKGCYRKGDKIKKVKGVRRGTTGLMFKVTWEKKKVPVEASESQYN